MTTHLTVRLLLAASIALVECQSAFADQANQDLLMLYRQVATETNPSVTSLASRSGWKSIYERASTEPDLVYHVFAGSIDERSVRFNLTATQDGSLLSFSMAKASPPFCIRRQDVLSVFGSTFDKGFWILETSIDQSTLPEEVKHNLEVFSYGPRYRFQNDSWTTLVTAYFNFSECAEAITLNRVTVKK